MNFKKKKYVFLSGALAGAVITFVFFKLNGHKAIVFDGFSSATPVAVQHKVPADCRLTVSGQVSRDWEMEAGDFAALAQTRFRCVENDSSGTINGAYIYQGVPLIHILEGVAPVNRPEDPFDRPLDMLVLVNNGKGETSRFSYGELTMCDDTTPVTLAYHRLELLPSKEPEKYTKNSWHGPHNGLRLVAPRDWDNSRFVDSATEILLHRPDWPTPEGTPTMKNPGKEAPLPEQLTLAVGTGIVWQGRPDSLGLPTRSVQNWRRVGHGRGIKSESPEYAEGIGFIDLLKHFFPQADREDVFLIVAIDGYRSLFSGRELLEHPQGKKILIQDRTPREQGWIIQVCGDFYVDRCVWGVSHIVRIPADEVDEMIRNADSHNS